MPFGQGVPVQLIGTRWCLRTHRDAADHPHLAPQGRYWCEPRPRSLLIGSA